VLLTILRSSVLPHKHPHELLDSVVKERFDQVFRPNRGRAFYSSLSTCQALFRKFLFYSIACRLAEPTTSRSGRRIIQRQFPLSTAFFTTSIDSTETPAAPQPPPCQRGAFYSNPPPLQPLSAI